MFDDALLLDYMQNFYGYGNFHGDYWFVGMEEGGGASFDEVQTRLSVWRDRGRKPLEDLRDYHYAIGITEWFNEKAKLQRTCRQLIRVLLEENTPNSDILSYQRMQLGRTDSNHAMVELLPLPNRSVKAWWYNQYSALPFLEKRSLYRKQFAPVRVKRLQNLIMQYQPKIIVFYSKTYQDWWKQIANVTFSESDPAIGTNGKTTFIIMQHPVAWGLATDYFPKVGQKIRTLTGSSP